MKKVIFCILISIKLFSATLSSFEDLSSATFPTPRENTEHFGNIIGSTYLSEIIMNRININLNNLKIYTILTLLAIERKIPECIFLTKKQYEILFNK